MAFTKLVPAAKVKSGTFKVSTVSRQGGAWHVQITIPSVEYTAAFGTAEAFDILIGDGEDLGKLLFQPSPEGAFKPTALKNCFLFRLPSTEDTPQIPFAYESPERRKVDGGLLVNMPAWFYEKGRWQEIQKARDINSRQQAAQQPMTRKETIARIGQVKA